MSKHSPDGQPFLTEDGELLPGYDIDYSEIAPNPYAGRIRHAVPDREECYMNHGPHSERPLRTLRQRVWIGAVAALFGFAAGLSKSISSIGGVTLEAILGWILGGLIFGAVVVLIDAATVGIGSPPDGH